jgi:tetratricopeptide (TPR) repeat protein
LRIYFYDADNNLIHQDSVTSNEVHSWRDVTLQGNTNTTTPVSKVRIGIYGIDNGFWGGTYGPAANNVRLTLGWITGSTQGSTTTGTMQVDIGEGGESTFVAPNGGTFISSNLRYESYSDPSCGANVTPNNLGGNVIQLVADNSVWDDPCGGQQKHLVGTLTYSSAEPQFIKDPSLLLVVQSSEANLTSAQQAEQSAQQNLAAATAAASTSNETAQDKEDELTAAQTSYEEALATFTVEEADLTNLENTSNIKRTSYEASLKVYETAGSSFTAAQASFDEVSSDVDSTKGDYDSALENFEEAETTFNDSDADLTSAQTDVEKAQDEVDIAQDELDSIPEYKPEEPKEPEIVKLPPLEDLTKVNFEEIKATDLTSAQAEQLKEAALETFKTAEAGSPEYNAALEALFVAAQQDDIVVDEALASIPGIGAAAVAVAEVLNLLSNVGADISPEAREDAQQATVAAVIVGQVAQAAMASAMMRRP